MWGGLTLTLHHLELVLAEALMPSLETIISHATLFWFFAIVVLCVIFFTCYYVPETKNRDLASVLCHRCHPMSPFNSRRIKRREKPLALKGNALLRLQETSFLRHA